MNLWKPAPWAAALACLCCSWIRLSSQEIGDPADLPPLKIVDDDPGLRNFDGYEDYLFLQDIQYFPRAGEEKKETVRLTFTIAPDLPEGTVISFTLEHWGLDYVSTDFKLAGDTRKDIELDWAPATRLAAGDYYLRSRIHLDKQPAAVKRILQGRPERFPPKAHPWPFLYMTDELRLTVPELIDPEVKRELWKVYLGFMDRLVAHMNEFVRTMEAVRNETMFVTEGKLERQELEDYVVGWRKKQGDLQETIASFEVDRPDLFYQSRSAFLNLRRLGRMVSKRARVLQNEVTEELEEDPITEQGHLWFDDRYPYRVDETRLQRQYDAILLMIEYPGEETEGAEAEGIDPAAAPGETAPAAGPVPPTPR